MTDLAAPHTLQPAAQAQTSPSRLTREQRAAIILVSLGPEHAAPLAELLGIDAMRRIRAALTELPHIREPEMLSAFAEFITQLDAMRGGLRGGEAEAAKMLTDVLGEALAEKIMKPDEPDDPSAKLWEAFGDLEPDAIAEFVGAQHGAVAAILLHKLSPSVVPEVLGLMPPEVAVETIGLMSRAENPSEAAIKVAERLVQRELLSNGPDPSSDPKIIMIGETLGTLPRDLRDAALSRLEQEDEIRAAAIRATLLRIEDLPLRLPTKAVQVVFKDMERDILVKGLAAAKAQAPDVSDFLLGNIAQRMADTFREEIDAMPEMDTKVQDRAIGSFVREMLGLARRDAITLLPPPTDDEKAA